MKRFLVLIIVLSAASMSFGQNERTIEEMKKMDRHWQVESYSSRDLKEYDRIVAEDFLITGSNGKTLGKAEKRANVAADYTDPSTVAADFVFKIDEANHRARVFKNTAISNGFIIEKYVHNDNKIDSCVYFTCTYLKRDGKWRVEAAQYTRINQK